MRVALSCAVAFLRATVKYFAQLGVTVKRVLTDNGSAFRSKAFAAACRKLGLRHQFTRAYRPHRNQHTSSLAPESPRQWPSTVSAKIDHVRRLPVVSRGVV